MILNKFWLIAVTLKYFKLLYQLLLCGFHCEVVLKGGSGYEVGCVCSLNKHASIKNIFPRYCNVNFPIKVGKSKVNLLSFFQLLYLFSLLLNFLLSVAILLVAENKILLKHFKICNCPEKKYWIFCIIFFSIVL